jgi:hypothetical protein
VVIKENEFSSNYLKELRIKEKLRRENPELPIKEEDDPLILVGDTIIVDNDSEPGRVPLPFHPPIQGEDEDKPLSPLGLPLSETQGLFKGLRVDESGDTGPLESHQNASKKKGKYGAQPSRTSGRLRGENPTENGIGNSQGFDAAIAAAEKARKTGDEDTKRYALLVALYSTANQEPEIP